MGAGTDHGFQPVVDFHRQSEPAFGDEHGNFPGADRRNQYLPVPYRWICARRELIIAVDPPDQHVGIEHDHPSASQSSPVTGSVGPEYSTTLPLRIAYGSRCLSRYLRTSTAGLPARCTGWQDRRRVLRAVFPAFLTTHRLRKRHAQAVYPVS